MWLNKVIACLVHSEQAGFTRVLVPQRPPICRDKKGFGIVVLLSDPDSSLPRAIELLDLFGKYSGLLINWTKSFILYLSLGWRHLDYSLVRGPHFKYLGILICSDSREMLDLNLMPILATFKEKLKLWVDYLYP